MLKVFGAALLAVLLVACASPLSGQYKKGGDKTLLVTKDVWAGYQEYLTLISQTNPGDFVVAAMNGVALGYTGSYCPGTSCITVGSRANRLIDRCKGYGPEVECILFAHSADILVNYKVMDE
jgi:hypothetical protein